MYEQHRSTGYDLMELPSGEWGFYGSESLLRIGTFTEVILFMVIKEFFAIEDIEEAITVMEEGRYNACHFGIYRTMIYPYDAETRNGKVAC